MPETMTERLDRMRRAVARSQSATTVQAKIDAERQRRADQAKANAR